jgi:hypothetical protein
VLAGLVPVANLVALFAFAFADWPVLQQLRQAQSAPGIVRGHPNFAPPPSHPAFAAAPYQQPYQPPHGYS